MPDDRSQGARPLKRAIEQGTRTLWQALYGLVEWTSLTSMSAPAGQAPTASTDDDDDVQVLEQYGFASRPPGAATAIVLAPGSETQDRVAIGVSSVGGRPATEAGDAAAWTAAGHQVVLDDDDALTVTGKDGQSMVMEASGNMTITLAANKSLTINVTETGDVKIGGPGAVELLKAQASQTHIAGAATFATTPGNFIPNDGGVKAMQSFAAYILGILPAPPGQSLVQTSATTRAKGE
jgi:phage gp45-like